MNLKYVCQHGVNYDEQTELCFYIGCKLETRLRNNKCSDCQIHQHDQNKISTIRQNQYKFSIFAQIKICDLEFYILSQKIDLNFINEQLKYVKSLIENIQFVQKIPDCLLFKILQISQLLIQLHLPIQDDVINEFVQFSKKQEENLQQLNLIQNNQECSITKAFNIQNEVLNYLAISPNNKFMLVGTQRYLYLYNISTQLNIRIITFEEITYLGQFSENSKQIILAYRKGIIIQDIQTGRQNKIQFNISGVITHIYVSQNLLNLILIEYQQNLIPYSRLVQFDLKSKRQIFSYNIKEIKHQVQFLEDQITFRSQQYMLMINSSTRKTVLKIDISHHQIKKFIILNKNEILSLQHERLLIIWNIDYNDNLLIKQKNITLKAIDMFRGNPSYRFFYLILNDQLLIVDKNEKYQTIYSGFLLKRIQKIIKRNSKQFNTDKMFIGFSKEWICILERHNKSTK